MKKITFLNFLWLIFPFMTFADYRLEGDDLIYDDFYYSEDHEYIYNEFVYVKKENHTGYTIIPASAIKGEEKLKHKEYQSERNEMQKNGYAYSDIHNPRGILTIQYKSSSEYPFLQPKLSDIELAFPYKGLDFVEEKNNVGYYGSWRYQDGWFEIGQYFKDPKIGICNYERLNHTLYPVNIRLIAEDMTDEINHKPTQYIIKGSDEVGYFAYLDWYDTTYAHHLHCAAEKFAPNYLKQVLELAIKIDQVK